MDPTILRTRLHYDPETGIFTWKDGQRAGHVAGGLCKKGYRLITISKHNRYYAHRLAWLYVHGAWPDADELDHENGNRDDNRLANLRPATRSNNKANSRLSKRNSSGLKGATYSNQAGKWMAQIFKGRRFHLGFFDTAAEAHAAYVAAARELFGEFANDGKQNEARP